jgi:hypothetical protein
VKQTGIAGSAIGAIFLALLMLRVPGRAPASKSETPASKAASARNDQQQKGVPDGPWLASRRHFSGITQQCGSSSSVASQSGAAQQSSGAPKPNSLNNASASEPRQQLWCIPQGEQVRAMMAIVADPVHTHMSLVFDRSLEAITLAAESANYVMDRYWLPWRPVSTGSSEESKQDEARTDAEPGLLMFRWNGPANQSGEQGSKGASLLYVFLVSDTSTAGINGDQFSHAVGYIDDVCSPNHAMCGGIKPISIMGPTFSGSLYSLRRLTATMKTRQFIAYSGTVSSICAQFNQRLLKAEDIKPGSPDVYSPAAECSASPDGYSQVSNLQFKSMVTDTETAVQRFLGTLQDVDKQIDCDKAAQVAILSEAATSYGTASRAARKKLDENEKASQKDAGHEKGSGSQRVEKPCYTNFSYPREISTLRNAYTSTVKPASGSETTSPDASQNYLPFDLADLQPNRSDEPPGFSNRQGPLSKEAVLMDFADDLRREHYKYVGIIGSNVLDVMFLASFLRTACPDIRLFVLNPDLLFERDSDNAPYIGTLALGTYPMVGRNLWWTGGGERLPRLPFADQYEESIYNASLLLIRNIVPNWSGASPYEVQAPISSQSENLEQLPVWLTVVGTGGFWPVQVIPPANSKSPAPDPRQMMHSDFSGAWKAVIIALSAVAFLQIMVLISASPLSPRLHDFAVAAPACSQRLFFINVGSSNLALCLALAAAPAWRFGSDTGAILLSIVAAVAIAALFFTCVRMHRLCRNKHASRPFSLKILGLDALYMAIWILAVLGAYVWDRLLYGDPNNYGFFFAYRSAHLATGVSPLTPMLPLGLCMYIWSIFEIWRLRFNDSMRPRLASETGCPGAETERLIAGSVKNYFLDPKYLAAFFVFLAAWLLTLNPIHPFQLFEHPEFGYLYETWFALVVCLMLASGFRLGQIWGQVRKLLRELERSPVRQAFSRLKGENWSPIWQSGGQEEEWINLARSFEVLNQIKICDGSLDPDLEKAITSAREARKEIHDLLYPAGGQKNATTTSLPPDKLPKTGEELVRRMQETFTQIQVRLATILNHALRVLQQYWSTHILDPDESLDRKDDKESDKVQETASAQDKETQLPLLLEKYVAIRYMAFIRAVLSHVRLLLIFLAISFSLMLISLNVYSFEPHQSLIWSFTAIFAVIGVTALAVLAEAHRNEILSRISGTKPNELGLSFYVRIASLGAAPLFTLLATHFPSIGRFLLSMFQPGLEALK